MENNDLKALKAEIIKFTDLFRNCSEKEKSEIEEHLVALYKELFKGDTELLKSTNKIDEKISEIKSVRPTNWSLKIRALESLKNEVDVFVTLLDGTKVKKSEVPIGEIYINEKGQKCRKVLKVKQTKPNPKENTEALTDCPQRMGAGFAKVYDNVTKTVEMGSAELIKISNNYEEFCDKYSTLSFGEKTACVVDTVSGMAESAADAIESHSDTILKIFKIIGLVIWILLKTTLVLSLVFVEISLILFLCPFAVFFEIARDCIKKLISWIAGEIRWLFGRSDSGEVLHFKKDGTLDMRFNSSKSFFD